MDIYDFFKNSNIYNSFLRDVNNGTVSHASIVYGRDNFALQKVLQLFACMLLCASPQKPCLKCSSCERVLKSVHPDCLIYPLKGEKLLVEDIDNITDTMSYRPCEGDVKVYTIMHGDTMNLSSQNKLLKTLEEPNCSVYMLIGTNNIENLLPTVRSRCKILEIELFTAEKIYAYLQANAKDEKAAKIASVSCGGHIGKAINMTENEMYIKLYNYIYSLFDSLKSYDDVLDCMQVINAYKDKQEILDIMQQYFRDCLMYKTQNDNLVLIKQYNNCKKSVERFKVKNLISFIEKSTEAKRKLQLNCNIGPVFETLLNDIMQCQITP